jgi:hypothetical protein
MPRMQAGRGDAEREGGLEQWLLQLRLAVWLQAFLDACE